MSGVGAAVAIGVGGASLYSASEKRGAAKDAMNAQIEGNNAAISETRRGFNEIVQLMRPFLNEGEASIGNLRGYAEAGRDAFGGQLDLLGLNGPDAEKAAIAEIRDGEKFNILRELGEESILNRASVTGGMRGGRTQGAFAEFPPALLMQLIDERYGKLGGIASLGYGTEDTLARLGQASAAQQAAFGQQASATTAGLLGDNGFARAGYALSRGNTQAQLVNDLVSSAGTGLGLYTGFGGTFGGEAYNPDTAFTGFNSGKDI